MRFSVITITFNAEAYLAETLRSVACQEKVSFEHILWDGGSQDDTLKIAHKFNHVSLKQGKDSGIADAMNRAARYAKGDFLLFLHADDLLAHSRVLLMLDKELRLHPWVEWLYGKAHVIDKSGKKLRTTPYESYAARRLRKYNFITHPAAIVSRNIFKKVGGFHDKLRFCMDYDLWLRLARLSMPMAVPTTLACFREHANSLSTKEALKVADEAFSVRNRYVSSFYERYRSYLTWKKRRSKLLSNE
jgi:glycosyltransferase involved in cell wall biosynthesis